MTIRVLHVTTVGDSLMFLRGQASHMRRFGFETHAVSSPGPLLDEFARAELVSTHPVVMRRQLSPLADVVALVRLIRVFRQVQPHIVHAHTPKGGLLGMLAAMASRVPVRIYHLHGLRFETTTGWRRWLLRACERLSCRCAHQVVCVSQSTLLSAENAGVCSPGHGKVLGHGSVNGIDPVHFDPSGRTSESTALRATLGIPQGAPVVGFVGRLVADKGCVDLAEAWQRIRVDSPTAHLLLVGPTEPNDPLPPAVLRSFAADDRVSVVGWVGDPAPFYALMSLLVLPSHREGFGLATLEAAAMELPVVASRIAGITDAVVDGVTGDLIPPRDPSELHLAVMKCLNDDVLSAERGRAGRARVVEHFSQQDVWERLRVEYGRLVSSAQAVGPGLVAVATTRSTTLPAQVSTSGDERRRAA